MARYTVTLTIEIDADSADDATEIAAAAAEHLQETFNDDGSFDSVGFSATAKPE